MTRTLLEFRRYCYIYNINPFDPWDDEDEEEVQAWLKRRYAWYEECRRERDAGVEAQRV